MQHMSSEEETKPSWRRRSALFRLSRRNSSASSIDSKTSVDGRSKSISVIFQQKDGLRASQLLMSDEQRIEIMNLVKSGSLSIDEAIEKVKTEEEELALSQKRAPPSRNSSQSSIALSLKSMDISSFAALASSIEEEINQKRTMRQGSENLSLDKMHSESKPRFTSLISTPFEIFPSTHEISNPALVDLVTQVNTGTMSIDRAIDIVKFMEADHERDVAQNSQQRKLIPPFFARVVTNWKTSAYEPDILSVELDEVVLVLECDGPLWQCKYKDKIGRIKFVYLQPLSREEEMKYAICNDDVVVPYPDGSSVMEKLSQTWSSPLSSPSSAVKAECAAEADVQQTKALHRILLETRTNLHEEKTNKSINDAKNDPCADNITAVLQQHKIDDSDSVSHFRASSKDVEVVGDENFQLPRLIDQEVRQMDVLPNIQATAQQQNCMEAITSSCTNTQVSVSIDANVKLFSDRTVPGANILSENPPNHSVHTPINPSATILDLASSNVANIRTISQDHARELFTHNEPLGSESARQNIPEKLLENTSEQIRSERAGITQSQQNFQSSVIASYEHKSTHAVEEQTYKEFDYVQDEPSVDIPTHTESE